MKSIIFLVLSLAIVSCKSTEQKEYSFDEVTAKFIRNTVATTFIKNGTPITGTVTQKMDNGGKNIWDVENGLATKQTIYYPNGQIEQMLEMKNGTEHGKFVLYFSDGQKYVEQFYKNGQPVGIWHRWNYKGELVETTEH